MTPTSSAALGPFAPSPEGRAPAAGPGLRDEEGGEGGSGSRRRRSVRVRIAVYAALLILTLLALNPVVLLLAMFMLIAPGLILLAAPWVLIYLPLVDWPLTAWRMTRNPAVVLRWLGAALILPVGLPLVANALADAQAGAVAMMRNRPAAPLGAGDTLLIAGDAGECGEVCQALLWSGAVDHVLSGGGLGGLEDIDRATLYTVGQGAACTGPNIVLNRQGYCVLSRPVTRPTFNRAVVVSRDYPLRGRWPLSRRLARIGADGQISPEPVWSALALAWTPSFVPAADWTSRAAFVCGQTCERGTTWAGIAGQHLALPFHFTMSTGMDNGFGLHAARSPFGGPGSDSRAFLRAAFGVEVTGFHPRPGFAGDVEQGNPGRLTSVERVQRQRAALDAAIRRETAALAAHDRGACEASYAEVMAGIAQWRAYLAAHPHEGLERRYQEEHPPPPCR